MESHVTTATHCKTLQYTCNTLQHTATQDPCLSSWFGVTCDDHGRVISLDLTRNNLTGVLPRSLAHLQLLKYVAVCCIVLQIVALCSGVLQYVAL